MATPYIGSRITLVSVSQIRYEGTLYEVDQAEASVSLKDVQMFGTEGRREGTDIPPNDAVYPFIKFRASDILELQVVRMGCSPVQLCLWHAPVLPVLPVLPVSAVMVVTSH